MQFSSTPLKARVASPLGLVILAATDQGLCGLWFDGQKHQPDTDAWPEQTPTPLLRRAADQLRAYFAGDGDAFDLPLDLRGGTPFQQSVWRALLQIPSGSTSSYGALSRQINRPAAVRAVGAAVGRNPVSIIVPCHRVLGADGSLTGYAGGLPRKQALLALERASANKRTGVAEGSRAVEVAP